MNDFKDKTVFITGASRGIGLAIGLRLAKEGANIVVTGKSDTAHPKLKGTIHSSVEEIEAAGGKALAVKMDARFDNEIEEAVHKGASHFGGIDVLINNAGAIRLLGTEELTVKNFDLMQQVNSRATFIASKACIPHLKKSSNPHILALCPPINLHSKYLGAFLGYSLSKYGMSLCVLGLSKEFKKDSIAVNGLWPKTIIATAAISNNFGGPAALQKCRKPEIVADSIYHILKRPSAQCTGNFFIDEEVLASEGISDLDSYAFEPGAPLTTDLFL